MINNKCPYCDKHIKEIVLRYDGTLISSLNEDGSLDLNNVTLSGLYTTPHISRLTGSWCIECGNAIYIKLDNENKITQVLKEDEYITYQKNINPDYLSDDEYFDNLKRDMINNLKIMLDKENEQL